MRNFTQTCIHTVKKGELKDYHGKNSLVLTGGSTTTKAAVVGGWDSALFVLFKQ